MLAFSVISCILAFTATLLGLKRDLMMLQQNSNRNDRYSKWMTESGESTRVPRLLAIICFFMSFVNFVPCALSLSLTIILSVWCIVKLFTAKYKKPLVFTKRAIRIYSVAILLMIMVALIVFILSFLMIKGSLLRSFTSLSAIMILSFGLSYNYIKASNFILKPVERRINKKYYDEAASILKSMPDLKVIGITGSYGKTSTKHYLFRILSEEFDVVMTPGNFNTTLGVIRTIREHIKPYNQIFIVEMGAKQPGDIKEICDLVNPQIGIITAVGPQHLESFGSIETVQSTKFELADALPSDGLAVVNNDFEYIANRKVDNVECARYAVDHAIESDYHTSDIEYSPQGTFFSICDDKGEVIRLFTRLVGKCNVSNLMAATIVALKMGVSKEKIRYAVSKIEQVEHRLSIKHTSSGITIIDDAYNSNPVGSSMALEVLSGMSGGKRIIITPGMIELGNDQYRLNKEFGLKISSSADVVIIVGEYNKEALSDGLREGGIDDSKLHYATSFNHAQQLMLSLATSGDTVLYENDLPDTFK